MSEIGLRTAINRPNSGHKSRIATQCRPIETPHTTVAAREAFEDCCKNMQVDLDDFHVLRLLHIPLLP